MPSKAIPASAEAGQPATANLHNPPPPPASPIGFDPSGLIAEAEQACPPAPPTGDAVPPAGEAPPAPETVSAEPGPSGNATLPWPPGRTGVIARHLYARSYSPIPEVAITAALGLLAGVCGRAYRAHTDTGAASLILSRVLPALRNQTEKVQFPFDPGAPIPQQIEAVLAAVAAGAVAPDVGQVIIQSVKALADVRAVEELEARIITLEAKSI